MNERVSPAEQAMAEARIQRHLKDDYRKVFVGTVEGRRVLTDLLQHTGVLRSIIADTEKETHYNAGKQEVGLLLMDLVDSQGYDAIIDLEQLGATLTKIGEEG